MNLIEMFVKALQRNNVEIIKDVPEDAHVSEALSAAADTGIIFFGSYEEAKSSALADHHVAVVRKGDICRTTIEAYKLAVSKSDHIFASSSASKTADIEGKLIWGMHGPRKFSVVIK